MRSTHHADHQYNAHARERTKSPQRSGYRQRRTRSMMSWMTLRSEDTYFLHLVGWMWSQTSENLSSADRLARVLSAL
jgi:hypothetical protein